jgi:hypothetical protein
VVAEIKTQVGVKMADLDMGAAVDAVVVLEEKNKIFVAWNLFIAYLTRDERILYK